MRIGIPTFRPRHPQLRPPRCAPSQAPDFQTDKVAFVLVHPDAIDFIEVYQQASNVSISM